jgi:hypothetical protein
MNPTQLLTELRRHGFSLVPEGNQVRIAPRSLLTPQLREALLARKTGILEQLQREARVAQMSLEQFQQTGFFLEVRVSWLPTTLWFVPSSEHADVLVKQGISRGRIWTAAELGMLWSLPERTRDRACTIGTVKTELDGEVVSAEQIQPQGKIPDHVEELPQACRSCGRTSFWKSTDGILICEICHPAPSPNLVSQRVNLAKRNHRWSNRGSSDAGQETQE